MTDEIKIPTSDGTGGVRGVRFLGPSGPRGSGVAVATDYAALYRKLRSAVEAICDPATQAKIKEAENA